MYVIMCIYVEFSIIKMLKKNNNKKQQQQQQEFMPDWEELLSQQVLL